MPEPAEPSDLTPHRSSHRGSLLRILGVAFGVAVTIGGSIGVGILRRPGAVAKLLWNPWLILAIWTLGGVFALLSALTVAELSTMLPRAGGFYVFAREAFGDATGLASGWSDWLANTLALSLASVTLAEMAATLIPSLAGKETAMAVAVVATVTFITGAACVVPAECRS